MTFDPFGDYLTEGYLRNIFKETDLEIVKDLEKNSFSANILDALDCLDEKPIDRNLVFKTHEILFKDLYPWAGQSRAINAPNIAISKGGYDTMFSHPSSVNLAIDDALRIAQEPQFMPGSVYSALAYAHPFLDGNGRTILTIHSEIMRRNNLHVEWEETNHSDFLNVLTEDLHNPGQNIFDRYLDKFIQPQPLTLEEIGQKLRLVFEYL